MNADSAFQIGATHAVCQDYAAAGLCGHGPYAVLSDGCSSSPDTDIGARLLVKAAERLLRESGAMSASGLAALHAEAARLALSWAEMLGLEPQAVDATLLTAHVGGDELLVGCSGDGVVCLQTADGALDVYSVNFPSGYPVYPAYAHQPARLRGLADAGRACREVTRLRAPSVRERLRQVQERLRRVDVSGGDAVTEVFAFDAAAYRFASLLSDGVHTFQHAEAVPLESVLPELVSFKNTRGAFAGRRMKMFLKDCRRKGWRHADDLSLAALHLGG